MEKSLLQMVLDSLEDGAEHGGYELQDYECRVLLDELHRLRRAAGEWGGAVEIETRANTEG